jgi:hypothetical protein
MFAKTAYILLKTQEGERIVIQLKHQSNSNRVTLMVNPFCMGYKDDLKKCIYCYAMAYKFMNITKVNIYVFTMTILRL